MGKHKRKKKLRIAGMPEEVRRPAFGGRNWNILAVCVAALAGVLAYAPVLFGPAAGGRYSVGLLLHAISAFLVAGLVFLLQKSRGPAEIPASDEIVLKWQAYGAGLLFFLHPVQTSLVSDPAGRVTLLAYTFYLVSLCLYAAGRLLWAAARRPVSVGTLALSFVSAAAYFFFSRLSLTRGYERLSDTPVYVYFVTQLDAFWVYARLLVWPFPRVLNYAYPVTRDVFLPGPFLGLIACLALFVLAMRLASRHRTAAAFGLWWFLLARLPQTSFISYANIVSEPRLYVPLAGVSIFICGLLFGDGPLPKALWRRWLLVVVLAVFSVMTCLRNADTRAGRVVVTKTWGPSLKERWAFAVSQASASRRQEPAVQGLSSCERVKQQGSRSAQDYFRRGRGYLSECGDATRAMEDFDKAIALRPNFAQAYYFRGYVNAALGRTDAALSDFQNATSYDKKDYTSYCRRADLLARQGRFDEAVADYSQAIAIFPSYYDACLGRGQALMARGDLPAAFADLDRAVRLKPFFAEPYRVRGLAYQRAKKYEEARKDLRMALELDPENAATYQKALAEIEGRSE